MGLDRLSSDVAHELGVLPRLLEQLTAPTTVDLREVAGAVHLHLPRR